jgi:hypothetical protein
LIRHWALALDGNSSASFTLKKVSW